MAVAIQDHVHEHTGNQFQNGVDLSMNNSRSSSTTRRRELLVSNTEITVQPENRKEFFQTVTEISNKIRHEEGCVSFRLFEEAGNENSLMLVGEWDNKTCWETHSSGENFAILHGSVQVLSVKSKIGHKLLSVLED
jgi:quinol monooxygenase YgiN